MNDEERLWDLLKMKRYDEIIREQSGELQQLIPRYLIRKNIRINGEELFILDMYNEPQIVFSTYFDKNLESTCVKQVLNVYDMLVDENGAFMKIEV